MWEIILHFNIFQTGTSSPKNWCLEKKEFVLKQVRYRLHEPSHETGFKDDLQIFKPTGPKKKIKLSKKENQDILNKLEVGFNLVLLENTIEVQYKR